MTEMAASAAPIWRRAQFLWVRGALSKFERLCLQSFLDHGYEVTLYHYGPVAHVPEGVILKDGNDILPDGQGPLRSDDPCTPAFSDLFRYHLLYRCGGWWFYTDYIALRPPLQLSCFTIASSWEGQHGQWANNSAMFAPTAGLPILRDLIEEAERRARVPERHYADLGPHMLQGYSLRFPDRISIAPWHYFCAYHWRMATRIAQSSHYEFAKEQLRSVKHFFWELIDPHFKRCRVRKTTIALHLWNDILRRAGMDKNATYHPLSRIERYKRRHGVT